MVFRCSKYVSESTSDDETIDADYVPNQQPSKPTRKPTRVPKCFTKNALMARNNRLKKKQYISTLEDQVSSLTTANQNLTVVVKDQSLTIQQYKKEVSYLKSIISNSDGIRNLVKCLNHSTNMTVTSSIDKNLKAYSSLSSASDYKFKRENSNIEEQHMSGYKTTGNKKQQQQFWKDENACITSTTTASTPEYTYSPQIEDIRNDELLLDMDIPLDINNEEFLGIIDENVFESPTNLLPESNCNNENKAQLSTSEENNEVGVCLHVSKNKVSLEFCPICSQNATETWKHL